VEYLLSLTMKPAIGLRLNLQALRSAYAVIFAIIQGGRKTDKRHGT